MTDTRLATPRPWRMLGNQIGAWGHRAIAILVDGNTIDAKPIDIGSDNWDEMIDDGHLIVTAVNTYEAHLECVKVLRFALHNLEEVSLPYLLEDHRVTSVPNAIHQAHRALGKLDAAIDAAKPENIAGAEL